MHVAGIFLVFGTAERPECFPHHHFGEAQDGIERRAQFVAHARKEHVLACVRFFRPAMGFGIFFGEPRNLDGLRLRVRPCGLELADQLPQLGFLALECGNVGPNSNNPAFAGPPLNHQHPSAVGKLLLEAAARIAVVLGAFLDQGLSATLDPVEARFRCCFEDFVEAHPRLDSNPIETMNVAISAVADHEAVVGVP